MKRWLSQPTSRKGAYFHAELAVSNSVPLVGEQPPAGRLKES